MSRANFLLTVVLVCVVMLATGTIRLEPAPSAPTDQTTALAEPSRPAPAAPAQQVGDIAANPFGLLDRAIAALAPDKLQWLDTTVWQQVDCDDLHYDVQGRFLSAPGHRARLQMQVRVGDTKGQWQVVSDGTTLSQLNQTGAKPPTISQLPLPAAQPGHVAAELALARDQFLLAQGVAGVRPLLQSVRAGMQQPRLETIRWGGHEVWRISGAWPASAASSLPNDLPAGAIPRHCRVILDSQTLWPYRVEWWRGSEAGRPMALLSQTEFRQAVLNRPLSAESCEREFTFEPPEPE